MTPFLYRVASLFYKQYGNELSHLAFVFPNRRAGLFFQKYLSEMTEAPLFSPTILTINDLFVQLSGLKPADKIGMLFTLYNIYVRRSGSTESFDEFLYWGEMLLNDFDDVDKYMADARMLFTNVTDLKEIENDFSFLSKEQIEAIRSFWSTFSPGGDAPNQREFLAVWEILYALYTDMREALTLEGRGYEGMIFREVVERMEEGEDCDLPYEKVVFVGLNALSEAEERFLKQLQKRGIADFYWDYASDKVRDTKNKASFFVERNLRNFPSGYPLELEEETPMQIDVIGVPSGIGQAKHVYTLLGELCKETNMSDEKALRTAVVLPDEHLLVPILSAIPSQIRRINITMGYPLAGTPVASLMEHVLALQKTIRNVDQHPMFYFRYVLPILNHQYVCMTDSKVVAALAKDIAANNRNYISQEDLGMTPLLKVIFRPVTEAGAFSDYLIDILQELNKTIDNTERVEEEEDDQRLSVKDIEQEFIFHYFTTVNRLRGLLMDAGVEVKIDTYFRLLRRLTDSISIPFRGEPLSGLQIMGVLETRALDFDRLIILSMNEGVFPLKKAANSFIPYNLRRGFGLPTYEHQDSVWAYHFYRLIYRASHVSLLYDTRSDGMQTGEVSRFVHQLHYLYNAPIRNKLIVFNVSSTKSPALKVRKTEDVMHRLEAFLEGGERSLSASAINTYLDCPLKFYFSTVEGVREEDKVSETIESNTFGTILHSVMEKLYAPLCGKMVTNDLLEALKNDKKGVTIAIEQAFAESYFKTKEVRPLIGQNFLFGEMIRKYVEKILECDGKLTPFRYLESERRVNGLFTLSDGQTSVRIKGFVDRIDEVGGSVRIVDYKSGKAELEFDSVESLFNKTEKERAKAVMQVFLYALMLDGKYQGKTLKPVIYHLTSLSDTSIYHTYCVENKKAKQKEEVTDFSLYAEDFETALRCLLDEIFDEETPFMQTMNEKKNCVYCPYKNVCGKNTKKY